MKTYSPVGYRKAARTLASVALIALACGRCSLEPDPVELPKVQKVILITIDTLRADHVSSYGYPVETSPWLDKLVEKGVSFHRAYSHSATTKPSHSSLFTSLYPLEHGVVKNTHVLSEDFLTMAEMFKNVGYRTAGFVSTDVPLNGNVGQGFDRWDPPVWMDPKAPPSLYRSATETVDRAVEWLEGVGEEESFFLWVHLYDPHNPLKPPEDPARNVEKSAASVGRKKHRKLLTGRDVPVERDHDYEQILRYDGEIRYADSQLARLEAALEGAGHNEETLWVVTSDHGQGLGSHDWWGHSVHIYNAQLHVPLIFWFSDGSVPVRRIDDHLVQHVDVLPTLAQIVDGDLSSQLLPPRGRSLTPYLRGEPVARTRSFAFSQRTEYANPSKDRLSKPNYEPGSRYALQSLDYKYLLFTEGEDEFYELEDDPYELVNLIDDPDHSRNHENFANAINALVASASTDREVGTVSEEDLERLRALGYLQ